jgi:hypothetical protein
VVYEGIGVGGIISASHTGQGQLGLRTIKVIGAGVIENDNLGTGGQGEVTSRISSKIDVGNGGVVVVTPGRALKAKVLGGRISDLLIEKVTLNDGFEGRDSSRDLIGRPFELEIDLFLDCVLT